MSALLPVGAGRSVGVLIASNVLGGVGVASGVAVGGLLAEQLGGTAVAGLAQAASVLGAAIAAIPLSGLAARRGRRWSLSAGYGLALMGAVLVIVSAVVGQLVVLLVGLGLFGVAQAANLQSRYAASENSPADVRARTMSVVIWATTVGSVAGPNISAPGARLGESLGLSGLAGPYLFSVVSFASAATVIALLFRPRRAGDAVAAACGPTAPVAASTQGAEGAAPDISMGEPVPVAAPAETGPLGARAALRWAMGRPRARFAVVLTAVAHAVMVMVMVMTPLHMQHGGMSLELVGLVISLHVLGMFALSPVFGWAADRFGAVRLATVGLGVLLAASVLGYLAAVGTPALTAPALVVLGLGWSASIISASAVLAEVTEPTVRLPLQGATDAAMNYAGAGAAALAGPVLAAGGFEGVNMVAALLLVPAVLLLPSVGRAGPDRHRTTRSPVAGRVEVADRA